jgi:acyl carrier protein
VSRRVRRGRTLPDPEDAMPTQAEIFEKVQATLVDALGVDEEDVTKDATLFKDLGAESIDLLDIVFRLERNFGIKIPRGELFPENVSDPEMVENGKLTERGLAEIKGRMPYADLTEFEKNPDVEKLFDLYTVDTLVQYVASKLSANG